MHFFCFLLLLIFSTNQSHISLTNKKSMHFKKKIEPNKHVYPHNVPTFYMSHVLTFCIYVNSTTNPTNHSYPIPRHVGHPWILRHCKLRKMSLSIRKFKDRTLLPNSPSSVLVSPQSDTSSPRSPLFGAARPNMVKKILSYSQFHSSSPPRTPPSQLGPPLKRQVEATS